MINEQKSKSNSSGLFARRALLRGAAAGLGGGVWTRGITNPMALAAEPNLDQGWIDAHTHVWTPDTTRYPLAPGHRAEDMRPPSFTLDEFFRVARPEGVTRAVLIQMSFYGFDNGYLLECLAQRPGALAGVAVIDETAERPEAEMRRLAKQGVRGFRIGPSKHPHDRWLATPGMIAMWRCAARERLAICPLMNPDALPALDAMCRRHPEATVVVDHCARIGIDGKVRESDVERLCALARHAHTYVKVSAFYALGRKRPPYDDLVPMIRRLFDAFGPQRLMWASDCPYQAVDHSYADSIGLVRDRLDFVSAEDRVSLLRGTAERVFFRKA